MGILGFYGDWIRSNIANADGKDIPPNIATLAIDMNGLLHTIAAEVYGYGESITPLMKKQLESLTMAELEVNYRKRLDMVLTKIISIFKPSEWIILAIDGVAPLAKIQQQRQRRYAPRPPSIFDSNAITPGTEWMIALDLWFVDWLNDKAATLPKVIYSSHLVPGEAEHKIADIYRSELFANYHNQGSINHILYGLDADLVMIALLSPVRNIWLSRVEKESDIEHVIQIENIRSYIEHQFNVEDFVVLIFLLGNDFLPTTPAFYEIRGKINVMLEIRASMKNPLTIDRKLNWTGIAEFLSILETKERLWLEAQRHNTKRTHPFTSVQRSIKKNRDGALYLDLQQFHTYWYDAALLPQANVATVWISNLLSESKEYKLEKELRSWSIRSIADMCNHYIRGWEWVFRYYTQGVHAVNVEWNYPYHRAPLIFDFAIFARNTVRASEIRGYTAFPNMRYMTSLHQLVSVLPRRSKALTPEILHPLFALDSPLIDLFPAENGYITDKEGRGLRAHAPALLPMVDLSRIFDAITALNIPEEISARWSKMENEEFPASE